MRRIREGLAGFDKDAKGINLNVDRQPNSRPAQDEDCPNLNISYYQNRLSLPTAESFPRKPQTEEDSCGSHGPMTATKDCTSWDAV